MSLRFLQSAIHIPRLRISSAAVLFLILISACWAQKPKINPLAPKPKAPEQPSQLPSETTHELTAADLETFLDGLVPLQLAREDIAGVTISVVKDGKLFFAKGYGFSDVSKRAPVLPDRTLFRPGSISKLFTWTAVMQQVEQGKIDLDRDVNDYLDFKIPATFPKPITMRDIMTHTPGFEETLQELFVLQPNEMVPLANYVKAHLPERIYPPFTVPAYSNYATTVAGYIVQRVSGQPFDNYIEDHILKPLGMNHTTFRQPLPDALKDDMSKGYQVASQPPKGFEYVVAAPAGACSITAADAARFMLAHLQDGTLDGVQILRPETARLMHSRQFENLPDINAMALGFYEETRNGHRIIGHGGDTEFFHSDLHLVLDAGFGFFLSYNSAGKGETSARDYLWHKVLDRYFPYTPPAPAAGTSSAADTAGLFGKYLSSRRADTTIMKVFNALGQPKVFANDDGTISVKELKDPNGEPKRFKSIGPMLYRETNGQSKIGFKKDYNGRTELVIDYPFMVFQKSPWNENGSFQVPLIVTSLIILLLTLLLWPVAAIVRRHYGRPLELTEKERRLRLLIRIGCALDLAFIAGFAIFFTMMEKDISLARPAFNPILRLLQILGWLGCIGALIAVYNAVVSWGNKTRWVWGRVADIVICLGCIGFVWFVFTWNMLHLSLKY